MYISKPILIILLLCTNFSVFGQFRMEKIKTVDLDQVIISSKKKLPDLYIHELKIDSIVKKGVRIVPKIVIGNKGTLDADRKKWSWFFYIDGKLVSFNREYFFDLKAGYKMISGPPNFKYKYGHYTFKKKGVHTYKLIIKTKKKFKEIDKKNNIIEGTIRVVD